jgi:hypothetical protein
MNKSEMLRQEARHKEENRKTDYVDHPLRARSKSAGHSGAESEGEEHEEGKEIYLTKAEKLRREYLKFLAQNDGKKRWGDKNVVSSTTDDEDGSKSDGDASGARPKSAPVKLKVRLNRAQQLRLKEAEEKQNTPTEPVWHTTKRHKNVEARIDFGHEGWQEGIKAAQAAERDRELQITTAAVDEADYDPEIHSDKMKSPIPASGLHLYHGFALREGYILPEPYSSSATVYWSADPDDSTAERSTMYGTVFPRIRDVANNLGLEFLLRDLKWGVPKGLLNKHELESICAKHIELAKVQVRIY